MQHIEKKKKRPGTVSQVLELEPKLKAQCVTFRAIWWHEME